MSSGSLAIDRDGASPAATIESTVDCNKLLRFIPRSLSLAIGAKRLGVVSGVLVKLDLGGASVDYLRGK